MKKSRYTKTQRILAVIGIVLLVALYVTAVVASLFRSPLARSILMSAVFCTVAVPVIIYLFQYFIGKRKTSGDDGESDESGANESK